MVTAAERGKERERDDWLFRVAQDKSGEMGKEEGKQDFWRKSDTKRMYRTVQTLVWGRGAREDLERSKFSVWRMADVFSLSQREREVFTHFPK